MYVHRYLMPVGMEDDFSPPVFNIFYDNWLLCCLASPAVSLLHHICLFYIPLQCGTKFTDSTNWSVFSWTYVQYLTYYQNTVVEQIACFIITINHRIPFWQYVNADF